MMPRGVHNNHKGGRKPSSLNVLRKEAEIAVKWSGQSPMEFLQGIMQDETQDMGRRIDAAKIACIYVHRKQPEAQEHTVNVPKAISIVTPFAKALADAVG